MLVGQTFIRHARSGNCVVSCVFGTASTVLTCVESGDPSRGDGALEAILAQGMNNVNLMESGSPQKLAERLDMSLRTEARKDHPTWLFFAAVLLKPSVIEVAVAGSFRVHLVREEALVATTHDHILKEEDTSPSLLPPGFGDLREVMTSVPTRSLGGKLTLPPEVASWEVNGPSSLVLCSTDFHRYSQPTSYLGLLGPSHPGRIAQHSQDGLVAVIKIE